MIPLSPPFFFLSFLLCLVFLLLHPPLCYGVLYFTLLRPMTHVPIPPPPSCTLARKWDGMECTCTVLYSMHVQQNKPSSFVPSYLIFFFFSVVISI